MVVVDEEFDAVRPSFMFAAKNMAQEVRARLIKS